MNPIGHRGHTPTLTPRRIETTPKEAAADTVELGRSADFATHREWLLSHGEQVSGGDDDFNEEPSNRDLNQSAIEQRLLSDLGEDARIQYHQDVSRLEGRILTSDQLFAEFRKLAGDPEIPFEYITDGCYARAHKMCETMREDQVNCGKMFVMLEDIGNPGRLEADNKYMHAEWWYHVAPLVFAEDEAHQISAYIMDPSMADHPLKAEDWVHQMWDEETPIKIDLTRAPQYGPFETDGAYDKFEDSIDSAHSTLERYSRELEEIKERYDKDHPKQEALIAA
ncbi:MAG: hypothetical protein KC910_19885 [Candidatus Eremiobacteraeota bacterium]|nr:hypothetical protein [Candidatus Eremiobacteraeota bacterium]